MDPRSAMTVSTLVLLALAALPLLQAVAAGTTTPGGAAHISVRDFGAEGNWDWGNRQGADDTAAIQKAIDYAASPGATSAVVYFPPGSYCISTTLHLPNWVRLVGDNGRNSQIHASPEFTGDCMFHAANGNQSMFHSRLEHLWIRVHDNPAIQAVIRADAWQENCGMSHVVISGFVRYGLELQHGFGGAATLHIEDCEIFAGSQAVAASAGIYVHQISLVAGFMLRVDSTTITGDTSERPLGYGIFMENDTLLARAVHFEYTRHGVWLQQKANAVLDGLTGSYTRAESAALVTVAPNWEGFLSGRGLMSNGFEYLLRDGRSGQQRQGNAAELVLEPQP